MKKFWLNVLINTFIASCLATTSFCLIFYLVREPERTRLIDACFATGAFELAGILIVIIFRTGLFDSLNYTFLKLASLFRRKYVKKYVDAYDYKTKQQEKRSKLKLFFYPYVIVGVTFLVTAIIIEFI